jgi:endonuclease/exonuclease/phosphatase family metal-dependent hydrolase
LRSAADKTFENDSSFWVSFEHRYPQGKPMTRPISLCFLSGVFLLVAAVASSQNLPQPSGPSETIALKVMTFNLRYASDTPPNEWPARLPITKNTILGNDADIVGTQEGLYRQLLDLAEDLPDYDWIGEGRNGGSFGEFMAIFYKKDRFEPIAYKHLWLSETPNGIGSTTWGNTLPRMVTWALFREKKSGAEFYVVNTHFDHQSEPSRQRSAELLLNTIRALTPARPVVVTGDFNQMQGSIVHQTLLAQAEGSMNLLDSWDAAAERENEGVSTFHGYREVQKTGRRIDWILISPQFAANRSAIIMHQENNQFPSDHFPVLAELTLTY